MTDTKAPCTVEVCDRTAERRGMCLGHYTRWYRTGDAGNTPVKQWTHGRVCDVTGCDNRHEARGYCRAHLYRLTQYGDPLVVPQGLPTGQDHHGWRGDDISYAGLHDRIKRHRGHASRYRCVRCQGQAREWAYKNNDAPAQLLRPDGVKYSPNVEDYMPMCVSCHKTFDMGDGNTEGWSHLMDDQLLALEPEPA